MPTLTVTVWNVQDYGTFSRKRRGRYVPVHNFIAHVLQQQETDIFYLVEMQEHGMTYLPNLRAALESRMQGSRWFFDSVKGAIADAEPAGRNTTITTHTQLGWTVRAKHEGYAVFFRHEPAKFVMTLAPPVDAAVVDNTQSHGVRPEPRPADVPQHALSLVLEGRPPDPDDNSDWAYTAPAFNPAAPPAWNNLDFPTPVSSVLIRNAARRPAFCVIQLKNGAGAAGALMPLMVYHAPSNGQTGNAPPAGTQAASFARQFYQARDPDAGWNWVNNACALACGDFNVDGNPPALPFGRQRSYTSYLSPFAASGAGMTQSAVPLSLTNPAYNTALSLTLGIGGPPRPNGAASDFATAEFDNIFTRGILPANIQAPPRGAVYDLITAVQPGGSLTGVPVQNFLRLVRDAINGADLANGTPVYPGTQRPLYPQIVDWAAFYYDLTQGVFSTNRTAAEFITLFVSDHLPITFRFTY
jgi:hypothetical protein